MICDFDVVGASLCTGIVRIASLAGCLLACVVGKQLKVARIILLFRRLLWQTNLPTQSQPGDAAMHKFLVSSALFLCLFACAQECTDNICKIPGDGGDSGKPESASYLVLSPVPEVNVEKHPQGPRLDSLDGKTIALVGGSFMASVTHPELKRLLLAEYPTVKVYLLNEIGSAGPYPRPGVKRREKDEFQRRLREFRARRSHFRQWRLRSVHLTEVGSHCGGDAGHSLR